MDRLGLNTHQRAHIIADGFQNMQELVEHYEVTGPKEFERYLENLNKTFATASSANMRVYYNPGLIKRMVGCLYYFRHAIFSLHTAPDIELILRDHTNNYAKAWTKSQMTIQANKKAANKKENDLVKLKGSNNWIDFRDSFTVRLKFITSARGFPLDYIIDDTPCQVIRANTPLTKVNYVDIEDEFIFTHHATHHGAEYNSDCKTRWYLLESALLNTDPFNLISDHARTQNDHAAWKKLKSHYKGENYVEKIRNAALDKLKLTTYVHIKAHKQLFSIAYNNAHGLDDATKIHYFKTNLTPSIDLDTALSMARPYEHKSFQKYVTYLATEVDFKHNRKRQAMLHERKVSKVTTKDDKKKKNPSNFGPIISETVDDKKIESRRYSKEEFRSFTEN